MLVVTLLAAGAASRAAGQSASDVACYRAKDRAKRHATTISATAAGVTQSCRVHVPATLACLGSADGAFLCYPLSCPKPFPAAATLTDELGGTRVVAFKRAQLLCTPATRTAGSSSSTTTTVPGVTTTTAPSGPCSFDDNGRTCTGTCGGGAHCSAVASGGACECRSTACGDADAPSCEGYCRPDEACLFLLTGCECVSIP
jgi:hypothetical protein